MLDVVLKGVRRLAIDSAPFIYFLSDDSPLKPLVTRVFRKAVESKIVCCTSVVVLSEVLQKPLRENRKDLAEEYQTLLKASDDFTLIPVDVTIAEEAARLRAAYNLKTPDALMIATAVQAGCEAFLTNDEALRRVGELRVLILKELNS